MEVVSQKPIVKAKGLSLNAVAVVGAAVDALKRAGLRDQAKELAERAYNGDYSLLLATCLEYVEFEFDDTPRLNGVRGVEQNLIMPAGKYVVADPCYVLDDHIYYNLLENDAFDGERPFHPASDLAVWIMPTYHGDGKYESGKWEWTVDSGTIAIMQIPSTPTLFFKRGWEVYPQFEVKQPFTCERTEDGKIVFGNFLTIDTNPTRCANCNDVVDEPCDWCQQCEYCCECNNEDDDENEDEE